MYQVMLVDDEILVRERISKRIPWEELGFRLAAVCENGKEAMEVLQTEKIDLVLTDICMPYVDGLELAKFVYEEKAGTKVIILSGYDEFSYAKEALKYQALSYVLKPVTAAELREVLAEAKEKLDDTKVQDQAKSVYLDSLEILRGQFLLQLAQGTLAEQTWKDKCIEYGVSFDGERYCAVSVFFAVHLLEFDLIQIIKYVESISGDVLAFEGAEANIVLFVKKSNSKRLREEAKMVCQKLVEYAKNMYQSKVSCLIGSCVPDLRDICVSYQNALELKEFMYLERERYLYDWEFFQKYKWDLKRIELNKDREKRIVLAVKSNLRDEVKRELQKFAQECQDKWIAKNRAIMTFQSMIFAVMASLSQISLERDEELFLKEQESILALFQCAYLSEMKAIALRFFEEAAEIMNYNRSSYGERQAAMALDYIEKHYADPELSLAKLCQKLAISVSYFSTAFKEFTGKTFVESLTGRRMEQAKKLLESQSLKMYEIAERCGYKEANYFSATFKKFYGMTPREYAKQVGKGEAE